MATKARQQYHADEVTLSKERREFSISDDVQEKIDGIEEGAQVNTIETIKVNGSEVQPDENKAIDLTIPGVIDSLSSTSITDALSARQGKILYDKIDNVSRIGHFLALWDASTGLPVTDPETSPYEYHAGDFYIISVVASQGGTNYKPSGTEYISGQASTDVDTDDVEVNDFYFYDGQVWRHMKNSGAGDMVVDGSLSTTSRNPVENRVITNALSGKQNTLTAGANIQINGNTISATDTKYTAGTGISIANGVISNTQTSAEWGNITGTLSNQTDLQTVLTSKATDADVVHKTGAETIAGTKTFSTSPVVPSKTTAATNTGTAIATEAQVYKKQDTLVSGTNIKTINNTTLLGSGNITLNDVKSSATAPSSPTEGMLWYDTTNDILKAYNGTQWNAVDTNTTYNAGEGIEIGTYNDYSAMRGPCPKGFHIPTMAEWQAIKGVLVTTFSLSSNYSTTKTYLKLPPAGYRSSSGGTVSGSGSQAYYRTNIQTSNSKARRFFVNSSNLDFISTTKNGGYSLRGFKDVPEIPDSTWTTLYDGSSTAPGAGVFYNSTLGLISISGNGTTRYTISDKNVGATTVYNSGDTLSESNCGKFFQWGNNYGFPRTGTITTSATQVDTTGYGPGNYYSSSTFITGDSGWSSTNNDDLWGGATGVVTLENAITNTGVLSVNGQTGDVAIDTSEASSITTTQPSNPVEGDVYYDTTNDQLKVYDGSQWQVTGKEYNAGEGISIGTVQDYSAMRGPCPEGFHVPSKDELNGLINAISTLQLSLTRDIIKVYLKAPLAGYRSNTSGSAAVQDSINFWACTQGPNGNKRGWILAATSSGVNFSQPYKAGGESIRGFKDYPVTPDNSWTTLYDGSGVATGAGIYHNSTLGLISISSDGSNWITIADKNLGATTVYNSGDTLTDANCGYFYQWGNNYGFPHSGTITTSSTKVDARDYGPGNYYYSDTFITSSEDWSSVTNANLRGGVTGVVTLENAISNTGVLSVNGQTGDVTVKEYNAGEGIEIGTYNDYSAMQGPAPSGYHVPQSSEWIALCGILTSTFGMDSNVTTMGTYLKMPSAGLRSSSSSNVSDVGTYGRYWSSTASSVDYAYRLSFSSSSLNPQEGYIRTYGFPVRCFKDTPVIPDGSWDILYQGTGSAGVFRNSSLGFISVSGDGTTWYTIQDKNLGATIVYNQGDTLSDANCGNFYQWGNNYGFPHSGTVTTSATQVDTSDYGPGNYYSSSTFITRSSSPYDRSSVNNKNLRGGETGVITRDNAITNTGVLSVNGQTGNVVIPTAEESNTKTFYISSTSDLTNAQAALDWYNAGKNPIIVYDNKEYILSGVASNALTFTCTKYTIGDGFTASGLTQTNTYIFFSGDTVSSVTNTASQTNKLLATGVNYSTPYIPEYPGSPATKKYVDDNIITYNAGPGIEIGNVSDYSAMRGPCPEGFHVPSKSEFQAVTDAGITISAWGSGTLGTNMLSYLKIPLSGYHSTNISSPGTAYQDKQVGIHCCTCTGTYYADTLWFGGATSTYNDTWKYSTSTGRGFGYFIRPFKDTPITPDSDWTVLYDGSSVSSGAGIFHNADLGLISISGDGINWTTIADKNLGATIVYNNGDTLGENNCGGWFQRGNNYMFPFNASFTYSTDKVDATGYGPGNYYNSSTYIGASQWDTSNNKNLRGGETGVVTINNAITNTGVLSVNGQTGNVAIETFQLAPNSPLSPKYRWYGTQAQYDALTQYYTDEEGDTVYYTI